MKTEDRAIIEMEVSDDAGFTSPYSPAGKPVISAEVADFLDNAAKAYHPRRELALNVYGDCIDERERVRYAAAIRNYFSNAEQDKIRSIRLKTIISAIFLLVGVIALGVMIALESANKLGAVWSEVVDIFAWVFIWEAVDQYFIERKVLAAKLTRDRAFVNAEINFFPSRTVEQETSGEERR